MNDYENVRALVRKTGVSFEEAKYAYEACGCDYQTAERTILENKGTSSKSTSLSKPDSTEKLKKEFERNAKKAAAASGGFLKKLSRNNLTISGEKEIITLPVLAAAIIALVGMEIAVPAFVVSLFCGIKYNFSGPDFKKDFLIGLNKMTEDSDTESEAPVKYVFNDPEIVTEAETVSEGSDTGFFG